MLSGSVVHFIRSKVSERLSIERCNTLIGRANDNSLLKARHTRLDIRYICKERTVRMVKEDSAHLAYMLIDLTLVLAWLILGLP